MSSSIRKRNLTLTGATNLTYTGPSTSNDLVSYFWHSLEARGLTPVQRCSQRIRKWILTIKRLSVILRPLVEETVSYSPAEMQSAYQKMDPRHQRAECHTSATLWRDRDAVNVSYNTDWRNGCHNLKFTLFFNIHKYLHNVDILVYLFNGISTLHDLCNAKIWLFSKHYFQCHWPRG